MDTYITMVIPIGTEDSAATIELQISQRLNTNAHSGYKLVAMNTVKQHVILIMERQQSDNR